MGADWVPITAVDQPCKNINVNLSAETSPDVVGSDPETPSMLPYIFLIMDASYVLISSPS